MIEQVISIHITKNGDRYYLCDSKGAWEDVTNPESLLDFLLIDYGRNTCKVVWNLYALWGILEQVLPTEVKERIIATDRAWFGKYKIFSSSGKMLAITYAKPLHDNFVEPHEVNIYGLRQYFPNDATPDTLESLVERTTDLMATLSSLGWVTDTLSSSIGIYKQAVLANQFIPSVYDMPDSPETDGMLDYCYKMMCREWRSTYKVGHFQNATYVDIRSSYPSFIMNFGNTSECKIWHSDKLQQADFCVLSGIVHINKDYSPVVNARGQNIVGSYPDVITGEQWGFLVKRGYGSFEMKDGYFLKFDHPDDLPFKDLMLDLYKMREHGGLQSTLAKNTSVGVYGYQSQEYPERYGDFFNPIYSVMATSRCAIRMGRLIDEYQLQPHLISVTVDGLLSQRDIFIDTEKRIGGWKKEAVNALNLSIGHQYIESADKLTKDARQNTYSDMVSAMKAHPYKRSYNDVLLHSSLMTTNRVFPQFPKNGNDVLNKVFTSEPIKVGA